MDPAQIQHRRVADDARAGQHHRLHRRGGLARILFVTGKLAAPALRATLEGMSPDFEYDVVVLRISVAALMTTSWIAKHLLASDGLDRILIPGLCEGEIRVIEDRFGVT